MTIKRIVLALTLIVLVGVIVVFFDVNAQLDIAGAVLVGSYFAAEMLRDSLRNVAVKLGSIEEAVSQGSSEVAKISKHLAAIEEQARTLTRNLALIREAMDRVSYSAPPDSQD